MNTAIHPRSKLTRFFAKINKTEGLDIPQLFNRYFEIRDALHITEDVPVEFTQLVPELLNTKLEANIACAKQIITKAQCSNIFSSICKMSNLEESKNLYQIWIGQKKRNVTEPKLFYNTDTYYVVPIQFLEFIDPTTCCYSDITPLAISIAAYLITTPKDICFAGLITQFDEKLKNNSQQSFYSKVQSAILNQLGKIHIPKDVLKFALVKNDTNKLHSLCYNSYCNLIRVKYTFYFDNFKELISETYSTQEPTNSYYLTLALGNQNLEDFLKEYTGRNYAELLACGLSKALVALAKNTDYCITIGDQKIAEILDHIESIPSPQLSKLINQSGIDEYDDLDALSTFLTHETIIRLSKLPWGKKADVKNQLIRGALLIGDAELTKHLKTTLGQILKVVTEFARSYNRITKICEISPKYVVRIRAQQLLALIENSFNKDEAATVIQELLDIQEVRLFAAENLNLITVALNNKIDLAKYFFPQHLIPINAEFYTLTPSDVEFLWNHDVKFTAVHPVSKVTAIEAQLKQGKYKTVIAMLAKGVRIPQDKFKGALINAMQYSKNEEIVVALIKTHPYHPNIKISSRKTFTDVEIITFAAEEFGANVCLELILAGYHKAEDLINGKYITEILSLKLMVNAAKAGISPFIGGSKSALFKSIWSEDEKVEIFETYIQRLFQKVETGDKVTTLASEITLG